MPSSRRNDFPSGDVDAAHIAILDTSGVIIEVNEAWKEFARSNGYGGSAYGIGVNYISVCNSARGRFSDGAAKTAAGLEGILTGKQKLYVAEYACPSPSEKRWFQLIATPCATGNQAGVLVAHLSITTRKQSELKLLKTERRLRAIIDNSPTTISLKDSSGRYLLVNRKFCETFGLTEDQILGASPKYVLPSDLAEQVETQDRVTLETGQVSLQEDVVRLRGGARTLLTVKFPVAGHTGKARHIGSISSDVTEHRHVEAALRRSEQYTRTILHQVADGIVTIDQDGISSRQIPPPYKCSHTKQKKSWGAMFPC